MGRTKDTFMEQRESDDMQIVPVETYQKLDKASLNMQIQKIVSEVSDGNVNPLEAFIFLNWCEKVAKAAKDQLKEQAIDEAEKYSEKDITAYDATVTVKNGAGKYKYPDYIKGLQEQHKQAYKAGLEGNTITDEEGTVIEAAEYTPGSQTLNIKFK